MFYKHAFLVLYFSYDCLQVYGTSLSFFVNGIGPGYSATHTVELVSQIQEYGESWLRVGQTLSGMYYRVMVHCACTWVYEFRTWLLSYSHSRTGQPGTRIC